MKQAHRFSGPGGAYEGLTELGPNGPRWNGKIRLVTEKLEEPLHWKQPKRVFVNSMGDLFHEDVPYNFIDEVFHSMGACEWLGRGHVFQILTKRPATMLDYMSNRAHKAWNGKRLGGEVFPPYNIWLGVSVEDQKTADERILLLLQTPATVRFVSYEPALGAVDFSNYLRPPKSLSGRQVKLSPGQWIIDADGAHVMWRGLDWVICGGESGPGARPFNTDWARSILAQCGNAGVPCFIKQFGSHVIQDGERRIKKDKKGGNMHEWPHDLRVREFPKDKS